MTSRWQQVGHCLTRGQWACLDMTYRMLEINILKTFRKGKEIGIWDYLFQMLQLNLKNWISSLKTRGSKGAEKLPE